MTEERDDGEMSNINAGSGKSTLANAEGRKSDSSIFFTDMQPLSLGQQLLSFAIFIDTLPVHEHRSTDTPRVPRVIMASRMEESSMFVVCFIRLL